MSYTFAADETVGQGIVRIVCEQIDRAVEDLSSTEQPLAQRVHQARKRFKKIRAVLRLVRFELDDHYKRENRFFRDAGRELASARDAEARIEAFDAFVTTFADQLADDAITAVREMLHERRETVLDQQGDLQQRVETLLPKLHAARRRIEAWTLPDAGFAVLSAGLRQTYKRGRKALATAYAEPTPAHFHEWRKRVKYHWYHSRLLAPIWPELMKGYRRSLSELADVLGTDHDLAGLREVLTNAADEGVDVRTVQAVVALIDQRRRELQAQADVKGRRIYAERPNALAARFATYWDCWQHEHRRCAILA